MTNAATKDPGTKLDREKFIQTLDEVSPGLGTGKEIEEQEQSFIFKDGMVFTFNREVACRAKSGLPEKFKGAIHNAKLLDVLRRFKGESLVVSTTKSQLVLTGKNEKSGLVMEREILLPVDSVDLPKKDQWATLHEDFTDAVGIVGECAGKDEEFFTCTCVHIHPDWMEAFDNAQMTRYTFKTGVSKPFLVRRDTIKKLPAFDFTKFAETANWIHFKTPGGTVMSCLRFVAESGEFQNLTPMLTVKGRPTVLPKTLSAAAEKAEIFSKDESDENLALVEIRASRIRITGKGERGWYSKWAAIKYDGPPLKFRIAPKLLIEILKRHSECEISKKNILKVNGGKFVYAVCLEPID